MTKTRIKQTQNQPPEPTPAKSETQADPNKIQVIPGNTSVVTIQLLNNINQTLANMFAYIKNRDIEARKR